MHVVFKKTKKGKLEAQIVESRRNPARNMESQKIFKAQIGTFSDGDLKSATGKLGFWLRLAAAMDKLALNDLQRKRVKASAQRRVKPASALPSLI